MDPFSELDCDVGKNREIGNEFGTVTGRQRRCGWFDVAKHSLMSGIDGIAITKLDVLDSFKRLKSYSIKIKLKKD